MALSKIKALRTMQAVRKFTDREHVIDAFFRVFNDYLSGNIHLKVLMYYGVGGIGKTTLLRHLMRKIKPVAEERDVVVVDINLESSQLDSPMACLYAIYNQLEISSPAFEYGLARLWSLQGWSLEDIKRRVIKPDSLLFELVELGADAAGIFAPVRLFYRLLDMGHQYAMRWWGESKELLQEIEGLSEAELEERLPLYLGLSIEKSALMDDKKFVFFLDAHETILHRDAFETTKRVGDEWLREFIGSAENGLYVIAGREYLKWGDQAPEWNEYIEQHILGALSDEDADYFLSSIPIPEKEIRQAIIETSHGMPLYLDLCASTYLMRKQAGENPDAKDFRMAERDVIHRFISHLDREQAEALRVCALVERFDRQLLFELTRGLNIGFPIPRFHEFCRTSYTVQIDATADTYKIHDTVREFIKDEADLTIVSQIITIILKHCLQTFSVTNAARLNWVYSQVFTLLSQYPIQLSQSQIAQTVDCGLRLIDAGYWKTVGSAINQLLSIHSNREWPAGIRFLHALSLRKQGKLYEARAVYANLLERKEELEQWTPLVVFHAAHTTHLTGNYLEALAQYDVLKRIQGRDAVTVKARQLAYRQWADLQMLRGRFVDALKAFEELARGKDNPLWQAELHRFRGHIYRFNFHLVEAEQHYTQTLNISENVQAEAMRGKALTNFAETLCWISPLQAINYADEAIEVNRQVIAPIEVGKAMAAKAIALTFIGGKGSDALNVAQQAIDFQTRNGYHSGVLFALQSQGLAYFTLGNHDQARAVLSQMEKLSSEIGGMYAYIPMLLSILLSVESIDNFAQHFQWLDFARTAQEVRAIMSNFLKLSHQ